MFIKKDKTFLGKNILRFVKQPNGSLTIGGIESKSIIYYGGLGTIYTTKGITTYNMLIPISLDDFPKKSLLVFVSEENISFDIYDFYPKNPDCASANIFTVAIAKGNISVLHGIIKGTLIAGGTLNIDKDFGKVCYDEKISDIGLPGSSSGSADTTFTQDQWQELTP